MTTQTAPLDPSALVMPADDAEHPVDDAALQRLQDIIESVQQADELAQALVDRIDALHGRASAVQHSALEGVLERLSSIEDGLSQSLDKELETAQEAVQQCQSSAEQARNEAESAVETLGTQLEQSSKTATDEVQATSSLLSDQVQARVEQFAQASQGKLGDLVSHVQDVWSRAQSDVHHAIEDVLQKTDGSLTGSQQAALKASEEGLQRISQLKADVDDCARNLGDLVSTFSQALGATRTGLNVTAGTLGDITSIFKELG